MVPMPSRVRRTVRPMVDLTVKRPPVPIAKGPSAPWPAKKALARKVRAGPNSKVVDPMVRKPDVAPVVLASVVARKPDIAPVVLASAVARKPDVVPEVLASVVVRKPVVVPVVLASVVARRLVVVPEVLASAVVRKLDAVSVVLASAVVRKLDAVSVVVPEVRAAHIVARMAPARKVVVRGVELGR